MDFHSKKIIGYSYDSTMNLELTVEALKKACLNLKDANGIMLQTNLGTQHINLKFEDFKCIVIERQQRKPYLNILNHVTKGKEFMV